MSKYIKQEIAEALRPPAAAREESSAPAQTADPVQRVARGPTASPSLRVGAPAKVSHNKSNPQMSAAK